MADLFSVAGNDDILLKEKAQIREDLRADITITSGEKRNVKLLQRERDGDPAWSSFHRVRHERIEIYRSYCKRAEEFSFRRFRIRIQEKRKQEIKCSED